MLQFHAVARRIVRGQSPVGEGHAGQSLIRYGPLFKLLGRLGQRRNLKRDSACERFDPGTFDDSDPKLETLCCETKF